MVNELTSLAGRRILITGASSGIGRATAIMAAQLGAELVLVARREDELQATRRQLERPDSHTVKTGDLADSEFVRSLVSAIGPCDGFVHAAGVSQIVPASLTSSAMLAKLGHVNCGAFVELMGAFARRDNRREHPFSAVAVASVAATAGWTGGTAYCATKGALVAAVRALAVELAPQGVRVNAVSPSGIDTPLYAAQAKMDPAAAAARIAATQPLGLGTPEQVAAPICFLLGDAASFITGIDLPIDGGYLAK